MRKHVNAAMQRAHAFFGDILVTNQGVRHKIERWHNRRLSGCAGRTPLVQGMGKVVQGMGKGETHDCHP
jgi:hypothetical protein